MSPAGDRGRWLEAPTPGRECVRPPMGASDLAPAVHPYRWAMLGGAWFIYLCFGLVFMALAPLVGPIARELGMSHTAMGGVLGAWHLVYIVTAIPCGILLDRVGLRRSLLAAAAIMGLSGILRATATGPVELFLAVALFGVGGPLISVGGPKLIGMWFDGAERGLAMGIFGTGPTFGALGALALTNSLFLPLASGSWRMVLVGYGALMLVAGGTWLALCAHPLSRTVDDEVTTAPRPPELAVLRELLRSNVVRIVLLTSVGIFLYNQALDGWLPEILRTGGIDAVAAGYWASVPTAVSILSSLLLTRLAVPSRRLGMLLFVYLCAGAVPFLIDQPPGLVLGIGLVLQGIARGAMRPVALLVLMEAREVGPRKTGSAGGLFFAAAEIGGLVGPITVGYAFDLTGGFVASLYVLTGVCAVLVVLLGFLRRRGV